MTRATTLSVMVPGGRSRAMRQPSVIGRRARFARLLGLYALNTPSSVQGQTNGRPNVPVVRISNVQRPVVDGRMDGAAWTSVEPFTAFIQQAPNQGQPVSERTEIRFLIDSNTLFSGVVCFDAEPQTILVSQSRRDPDLTDTDSIRILLDTFDDGQNAFVFRTNPFGIAYDGQVRSEGQAGLTNSSSRHWGERR